MSRSLLLAAALLCVVRTYAAEPANMPDAGATVLKGDGADWSQYLADTAAGSVSAAGMLGVAGESVTTVENVRNIVVALQGLTTNDAGESLGVSITPARTTLAPMNLIDYANSWAMRLLGSLTFSYAQGPATVSDIEYDRKAYAVDTNFFPNREDDPVVAFAMEVPNCQGMQGIQMEPEGAPLPPGSPAPNTASASEGSDPTEEEAARAPQEDKTPSVLAAWKEASAACHAQAEKKLRWNRTQISLSYGDARIRSQDKSKPEESLGRTLAVGVIYAFDHFKALQNAGYALSLNYRRTTDEPVLNTLALPQTVHKDSSLFVARLTGGSESSRLLLEVSDVRGHDITASQRAFKQAIGFDYRVFDSTWLNLRVGKQHKIDESGTETGSMLTISYSPKALLTR